MMWMLYFTLTLTLQMVTFDNYMFIEHSLIAEEYQEHMLRDNYAQIMLGFTAGSDATLYPPDPSIGTFEITSILKEDDDAVFTPG